MKNPIRNFAALSILGTNVLTANLVFADELDTVRDLSNQQHAELSHAIQATFPETPLRAQPFIGEYSSKSKVSAEDLFEFHMRQRMDEIQEMGGFTGRKAKISCAAEIPEHFPIRPAEEWMKSFLPRAVTHLTLSINEGVTSKGDEPLTLRLSWNDASTFKRYYIALGQRRYVERHKELFPAASTTTTSLGSLEQYSFLATVNDIYGLMRVNVTHNPETMRATVSVEHLGYDFAFSSLRVSVPCSSPQPLPMPLRED